MEASLGAGPAQDDTAGREIGPRYQIDQILKCHSGIIDVGATGVDYFTEIVRRDVGRHADGNASRAVDQEIGKTGR